MSFSHFIILHIIQLSCTQTCVHVTPPPRVPTIHSFISPIIPNPDSHACRASSFTHPLSHKFVLLSKLTSSLLLYLCFHPRPLTYVCICPRYTLSFLNLYTASRQSVNAWLRSTNMSSRPFFPTLTFLPYLPRHPTSVLTPISNILPKTIYLLHCKCLTIKPQNCIRSFPNEVQINENK